MYGQYLRVGYDGTPTIFLKKNQRYSDDIENKMPNNDFLSLSTLMKMSKKILTSF